MILKHILIIWIQKFFLSYKDLINILYKKDKLLEIFQINEEQVFLLVSFFDGVINGKKQICNIDLTYFYNTHYSDNSFTNDMLLLDEYLNKQN